MCCLLTRKWRARKVFFRTQVQKRGHVWKKRTYGHAVQDQWNLWRKEWGKRPAQVQSALLSAPSPESGVSRAPLLDKVFPLSEWFFRRVQLWIPMSIYKRSFLKHLFQFGMKTRLIWNSNIQKRIWETSLKSNEALECWLPPHLLRVWQAYPNVGVIKLINIMGYCTGFFRIMEGGKVSTWVTHTPFLQDTRKRPSHSIGCTNLKVQIQQHVLIVFFCFACKFSSKQLLPSKLYLFVCINQNRVIVYINQ